MSDYIRCKLRELRVQRSLQHDVGLSMNERDRAGWRADKIEEDLYNAVDDMTTILDHFLRAWDSGAIVLWTEDDVKHIRQTLRKIGDT